MTKVTNLSKAIEIVKTNVDARMPKAQILELLVTELGVSRSNAFVYFTKASKAAGFTISVDAGATKKDIRKFKESIQGTSVAKKATKVAEIDAVIANLKKSGAKVASPFAALMS